MAGVSGKYVSCETKAAIIYFMEGLKINMDKTLDVLVEQWYDACALYDLAAQEKETATAALMAAMDGENLKKWASGNRTVTRVADSMVTAYDYKTLDAENPGLRLKYSYKKPHKGYLKK